MKNPTFFKVSFWLKGIITDSPAYCFFMAESSDDALKQFYREYGHIKVIGLDITEVRRNTQTYNTLLSIHKCK